MNKSKTNHSKQVANAFWLLIDTVLYAVFIFAYYFLVLHFLGDWLKRLFDEHKAVYAVVALTLIIAQGALLDLLTDWLFTKVRGKAK